MTTPDPFAADPIERDGYGRPKIIPVQKRGRNAGQPDLKAKLVPYTRVSTFAKALDDAGGLATWRLRNLALALGRNEELAAMAGVFGPTLDDCSSYDNAELDRIIETAHNRAGGDVKANHGTAIHGMTEPDRDPFVPVRMRESVDSYNALLASYGIEIVSSEQFVVCDELQVAGTFDHLYRFTRDIKFDDSTIIPANTVMIGDKKTGSLHFDSQAVQLAIYAHGKPYNPETGERGSHGASTVDGILAHIPKWSGDGPVPPAALYLIDLTKGWAAAKLAAQVRAHRSDKTLGQPFPNLSGHQDNRSIVEVALSEPVEPFGGRAGERVEPVVPTEWTVAPGSLASTPAVAHSAGIAASLTAPTEPKRDIRAEIEATEAALATKRAELAEAEAQAFALDADSAVEAEPDPFDSPVDQAHYFAPVGTEDEIVAALSAGLGAELIPPISTQLERCTSRDELAEVWRANKTAWTPMHTDVLKAMAAKFPEPVPA